jgi:hypothetical protein
MKDYIKRSLVVLFFWLFSLYLIYWMIIWKPIVQNQYEYLNIFYYILLLLICLYITIFYWIIPIHIKFSRATLLVVWLAAIIMWKTVFLNDPLNGVYIWDLCCVLWVIILIIWPTNLITTSKVKKKKEEKNLEIIEV